MPANRTNWICWYDSESQIYGAGTKEIALTSPLPNGYQIEDRHIAFITYHPDTQAILIHELPIEEIRNAPLKESKVKKSNVE